MDESPAIIIDNREQLPYLFDGLPTRRGTLKTGDYSLAGYEDRLAVERKSAEDFYGCVGASRKRFLRCLERLSRLERAAVVIESSLRGLSVPPPRTVISASQAVGSAISWSCIYRIPIHYAESREWGERVTLRFLMAFVKHQREIEALRIRP